MASADNKTKPSAESVATFLAAQDEKRRRDCEALVALMARVTGEPAVMWGGSMVGFGAYRYRYESGREGEMFEVGFSPRKSNLTLYIVPGFTEYEAHLARLGRYTTGKSCLYVKSLADVDMAVLEELIARSVAAIRECHPQK